MKTAEDILVDKQRDIVSIAWDRTVHQACLKMVDNKIGAILVKKDDEYVGIWSERDLLRHITAERFDLKKEKISDYMTSPLRTASYRTRIYKLEEMFLGLFLRHLLIEKEGEYIGMLSIGDVLRAGLLEKDRQFQEISDFVSWDYYQNWKAGRRKER